MVFSDKGFIQSMKIRGMWEVLGERRSTQGYSGVFVYTEMFLLASSNMSNGLHNWTTVILI